jgi:quinol monooxygenase YgiN
VVLIIAGHLLVDPADRGAYLEANAGAVRRARGAIGCLDFVQAADPLDPSRINIFERWASEEELLAFRGSGQPDDGSPPVRSAEVRRYIISSVEDP